MNLLWTILIIFNRLST